MSKRFKDEGKTIYDFLQEFYIKCPQCGKFAVIKTFPDKNGSYLYYQKRSLICDNCGFNKVYKNIPGPVGSDYPLWLDVKCCGERLWAYNLAHLEYIEKFVGATLREHFHNSGWKNSSMASRLPKWIQDGSNRDEILKCIEKMKASIPKR